MLISIFNFAPILLVIIVLALSSILASQISRLPTKLSRLVIRLVSGYSVSSVISIDGATESPYMYMSIQFSRQYLDNVPGSLIHSFRHKLRHSCVIGYHYIDKHIKTTHDLSTQK